MKLIIVSGLSGSGKSIVLNMLEDLDYYCIDNLPIGMLPVLLEKFLDTENSAYEDFAIGIDARNLATDLDKFPVLLAMLGVKDIACEVFFLEADDSTLIKRYSETRRKHPLTNKDVPLSEAIQAERKLLYPISSNADLLLDTSHTTIHQLRDLVRDRVKHDSSSTLSVLFTSFGFRHGIPIDADFVFDVRCITNPHWIPKLRALTGADKEVIKYLEEHQDVMCMLGDLKKFMTTWIPCFEADNRTYMTVAVGCTGGQHRSVYFTEQLAKHFATEGRNVLVRHRELS